MPWNTIGKKINEASSAMAIRLYKSVKWYGALIYKIAVIIPALWLLDNWYTNWNINTPDKKIVANINSFKATTYEAVNNLKISGI